MFFRNNVIIFLGKGNSARGERGVVEIYLFDIIMFKIYEDNNFVINYQNGLESLVSDFVNYYNEHIGLLLRKFHLDKINKFEIRLFNDKNMFGVTPYKLGDFAGFFSTTGIECYININGNKSIDDIMNGIMHEIVHHIYKCYIEEDIGNRITWFDEGLAMNFSHDHDRYIDEDYFIGFLKNRILTIDNLPSINELTHGNGFVNDKYNGYDLSYLVVRYLIEINSEDNFNSIMRDKKKIINIGEHVLSDAIDFYVSKYRISYKEGHIK